MTSELQQNRYDQLIRRVGGIIGPGSKVSEALTELFPVIDVERVPAELLLLSGTKLCNGGDFLTGVAAQRSRIQLFNPAGSGHIATITLATISPSSTSGVVAGLVDIELANLVATSRFRDGRLGVADSPVCEVRKDNDAVIAPDVFQMNVLANSSIFLQDDNGIAVLTPGTGYQISTTTILLSLLVGFYWRERPAEPSELEL